MKLKKTQNNEIEQNAETMDNEGDKELLDNYLINESKGDKTSKESVQTVRRSKRNCI